MIQYGDEEVLIEFKGIGELASHLPDTVDELEENRGAIRIGMPVISVTYPLSKLVPKTEPFFFNDNLETTKSTVIRIQEK